MPKRKQLAKRSPRSPLLAALTLSLGLAAPGCEVKEDYLTNSTSDAGQTPPLVEETKVKSLVTQMTFDKKPHVPSPAIKLRPSRTIKGKPNEFDRRLNALVVYFSNRDWSIFGNDHTDIDSFLKEATGNFFVVQGQSDTRGEAGNNEVIARKRAQSVIEHIKKLKAHKGKKFYVIETGESLSTPVGKNAKSTEGDRVALLSQTGPISTCLKQLRANHYLIESSDKMHAVLGDESAWSQVQRHPFEQGAKVHVFSNNPITATRLESHTPSGNKAPVLSALHELIAKAKRGESITVVTTRDTSSREHNYSTVAEAAKRNGVRVSVIGFNLTETHKEGMLQLARETGGAHCIIQEHE